MLLTLGIIPILIIIHTLKPKPRQVEVANLFLWNEVLKERSRNLSLARLKQSLPLVLQILIAALAALALAQPTWTSLTDRPGHLILVVDTSASMKTRSGSGIRFDIARRKALELVESRDQIQKVLIVEAGKNPRIKTGFTDDMDQVRELLRQLQPSDAPAEVEPAIILALSFVDPARGDSVYLITDGAGTEFSASIKKHPGIRPIIIRGGEKNVGVTKFEFRRQFDLSDHYEFMVEIKNFSNAPVDCTISLSIDRSLLVNRPVALEALEKKLLLIPYTGLITGIADVSIEIDDDFNVDNRAYLSLNAAKDIWILLATEGNPFLEKLLAAYPNFKVNSVKEIMPDSWPQQSARHDIVIVDRMDIPETERGNFLLIDAYSPSIPVTRTGRVVTPEVLAWQRKNPLMADVNLSGLIIEESARLQSAENLQPLIEADRTGLMYAYENKGLRAVLIGFDVTRSNLPLKVAFPVMMSNIFTWLNPHKLEYSILHTRAGEPYNIHLSPDTEQLLTRAPFEKWNKHRVRTNPFRYEATDRVGVYTISENGKERYFTVNLVDESESDILSGWRNNSRATAGGVTPGNKIPVQRSFWMPLIVACCALLMLEWYAWVRLKSN